LTREEWRQVWAAFDAIAQLPAADQARAIDQASDDAGVRRKLREMVEGFASLPESETIDTGTVVAPAPAAFPLLGSSIGRFEVRGTLGRGGVGEVYRAYDSELEREVAIKCVSSSRLGATNAIADFLREARAAGALNHRGIVTVYEVIRFQDTVAIVMELVEGRPMRALTGAPHAIEEVALWGQRIAEALAVMHAGGILHRDIKPENLIVRPDGDVKILDFGLAARCTADAGELPAGTVRYMSPEQARGASAITPATDIFSLGLVLYELASGVHPFAQEGCGNTTVSVAAAAATGAPQPLWSLVRSLPRSFDALVLRMLEKDPARRPSAQAVAKALRAIPKASGRRRRVVLAGALGALLLLACLGILALSRPAEPVEVRGTLLTGSPGRETSPAFSPDGKSVAYAWDGGSGGKRNIWIKRFDASDPQRVTASPADEWDPCWLAGGSQIAFLRNGGVSYQVVTVPVAGGAEKVVTTIGKLVSWMEHRLECPATGEDLIVGDDFPNSAAVPTMALYAISRSDGKRRLISDPPLASMDLWPRLSPDGRRLAFLRSGLSLEIRVVNLVGGPSRGVGGKVPGVTGVAWTADGGSLLYQLRSSDPQNVWEVPVSGGAPRRPPFLTESGGKEMAISPGGRKIAYSRSAVDVNLWRVFADGREPVTLAPSVRVDEDGAWSPDGSQFAFSSDRSGAAEIWVASVAGTNARQVTNLNGGCGSPSWSPDGKWIAFDFSDTRVGRIGIVPVNGGAAQMFSDRAVAVVPSWSRDGKSLYFCSRRTGEYDIWRRPIAGGAPTQVTYRSGFESQESADGRFLYFSKFTADGIWKVPLMGGGEEEKVAGFDRNTQFRCWCMVERGIYVASPGPKPRIDLLPFTGGRFPVAELPAELPKASRCLSAHPDGGSFLFPKREADRGEIYIADNPMWK
jgi:Tol biopolymer transport system component